MNGIDGTIILTHFFVLGLNFICEFQKGDTVIFVYISLMPSIFLVTKRIVSNLDLNFESWMKANSKENLGEANSFYLMNTKASEFIQKLKLKSIPRYILFDKEGKLVNDNASGPIKEACKTELLQLLLK